MSSPDNDHVYRIDTTANTVVSCYTASAGVLALTPDGAKLYVLDWGGVAVIDANTMTIIRIFIHHMLFLLLQ